MPKFTIINKLTGKKDTQEIEKDSILIGRQQNCDLALDSKTVSRRHAEIVKTNGDYFLVDLESGNGSLLNGDRVKPHEKNLLRTDDIIRIEEFEIIPDIPLPSDDERTDSGIIEIKMIKKVLSALTENQHPSLEGMDSPVEGKQITFTDDMPEIVIGRDKDCEFSIDSNVISRRHAVLQKKWGGVTVADLKSKNGTLVNDEKAEERILHDGDVIRLGNIRLLFKNPQQVDIDALSRDYEPADLPEEPELSSRMASSPELEDPTAADAMEEEDAFVSDQAKASLEPEKILEEESLEKKVQSSSPSEPAPEKEPEPFEEEPLPEEEAFVEDEVPPPSAEKKKKSKKPKSPSRFSPLELAMMGVGVAVLIGAIGLIVMLLS